jgi:anthranilate synthase/aminodeoxychorismate synthase-like glutamine amidotransferase
MILLIDNYDSFTYNLYQQLCSLGAEVRVVAHDALSVKSIKRLRPEKIVLSAGPGRPCHSGVCLDVIRQMYRSVPLLGVCLGHECIGEVFGARVIHTRHVMHGKTSKIRHNRSGLFRGIPNPFVAARYHSLALDQAPPGFELSATADDGEVMAIRHRDLPLYGIQFHPESFMTPVGDRIMKNFLYAD